MGSSPPRNSLVKEEGLASLPTSVKAEGEGLSSPKQRREESDKMSVESGSAGSEGATSGESESGNERSPRGK
jgi:hypothetical protein